LLAHVVLIEDLSTAVALARNGLRPYRLVTLAGELVEPWGGFAVAGRTETGIVSRRSEMDALREEVVALEARAIELRTTIESREAERDELVRRRTERESAIAEIDRRLVALEGEHAQVKREIERLRREREVSEAERTEVTREIEVRERERAECQSEETAAAEELARLEGGIRDLEAGLEASARIVEERASAAAIEKLELAQAEKEAEGLVELVGEREANLEMRERLLGDLGREIESLVRRRRETEETIVTASAELETMRVREEETRAALRVEEESDHSLQEVERLFRTEIESIRRSIEAVRSEREDLALREQEGRHTRNTILERIDEQYGIDLSALVRAKENRAKEAENALAETPALDAAIASEPIPELATEPEVEEASLEDRLVEEAAPSGNGTSAPDVAHAVESTQEGTTAETASDEESARESAPALIEPERRTEDLLARYLEPDPDWDRDRAREEIRELQDQLRKLGSVNLEAIDEIEELESRYEFQRAQKEDLDQSQRQLRALIDDINRKSREMFAETFARVQENFRELFRKSFGGGRAELELESGVDMLDAGIEIVARPPGKKLTSLSLMSGGEKTMTTIALLLAIFRSRPSPFCVLDEVDAPLDEANVQRFIVLLKEFVGQSQFIIITHNKRTMAEGETLYGVTMEERGVSKRVSVELESYDPERMELAASGRDAE
ncbi:MAG TPA: hypothetical protein VK116_02130, partial [Planctomycetota bacterium]|nr:hypothetical protein [Planctomycetota bacterium]